jgi:hypothetical protein
MGMFSYFDAGRDFNQKAAHIQIIISFGDQRLDFNAIGKWMRIPGQLINVCADFHKKPPNRYQFQPTGEQLIRLPGLAA